MESLRAGPGGIQECSDLSVSPVQKGNLKGQSRGSRAGGNEADELRLGSRRRGRSAKHSTLQAEERTIRLKNLKD